MVLPKLGGLELAVKLKAVYPGIQVIFMSGYTEHSLLDNELLDPAVNFIQKPFTLDALTQKVRGTLSARAPGAEKR